MVLAHVKRQFFAICLKWVLDFKKDQALGTNLIRSFHGLYGNMKKYDSCSEYGKSVNNHKSPQSGVSIENYFANLIFTKIGEIAEICKNRLAVMEII